MKKITTVLLTISACLLASCKPVLVSASKGKNLGLLLEGNPLAVNPSKSGQFLAARQALFNRDNAAAGFYFDQA